MSIIRVKKNENFTVMDNSGLQDPGLSWKAKGLLAFMLSRPDDWRFYVNELQQNATDGKGATASGIRELIEAGYIAREQKREKGRFKSYDYTIYETGVPVSDDSPTENPEPDKPALENPSPERPSPEKPKTKNPSTDNPNSEKQPIINTNNKPNTKRPNTKEIYTGVFDYWNRQGIIKHRKITPDIKRQIDRRLKEGFSPHDICLAIQHYSQVLCSLKTHWTHRWTLHEFLMRPNGFPVFLDKTVDDYAEWNDQDGKQPDVVFGG